MFKSTADCMSLNEQDDWLQLPTFRASNKDTDLFFISFPQHLWILRHTLPSQMGVKTEFDL